MFYPMQLDTICMPLSILYFKGLPAKISIKTYISVPTNSAKLDEMQPYVTFHLGLRCLQKYLFASIQDEKG